MNICFLSTYRNIDVNEIEFTHEIESNYRIDIKFKAIKKVCFFKIQSIFFSHLRF